MALNSLPKVIWEEGCVAALSHTYASFQNYPFPWTDPQTPLPASSLDRSDIMMPNGIRIRSTVFPQCTEQTDAPIDAQTDRSTPGKFDGYRPLRYESDAA